LTVLARLDGERKGSIVRFLSEATLIQKEEGANEEHVPTQPVISLSGADLIGANLSRAELSGAYLRGVELRGAKLSRTLVTTNPLGQVKSLEGSTMPDGQKYEEWIKSREEDG
jgi:uncharacterized protein YjbI with pentapeptide repeats